MPDIETRADLIKLMKEFGDEGVPARILHENGIAVPSAAAAELRRAGYDVEILGGGQGSGVGLARGAWDGQPPAEEGLAPVVRHATAGAV